VRELQNIITRACVLTDTDVVGPELIRPWLTSGKPQQSENPRSDAYNGTLADIERHVILETLERHDGHRARTAQALGIGVRTLSGKLRDYGVPPGAKSLQEAA
ncbi:MAG: hypothetical protein KDA37_12890, partial [Planctomycetales bacterium]|nr:hypothetical protein [Planctomycetales bacterium]